MLGLILKENSKAGTTNINMTFGHGNLDKEIFIKQSEQLYYMEDQQKMSYSGTLKLTHSIKGLVQTVR